MKQVNNLENKKILKKLLKKIFQFDAGDLDFGIYKILNHKKKEIGEFINEDLTDKIGKQLKIVGDEEETKLKTELDVLKNELSKLGENDYKNNSKYQKIEEKIKNIDTSKEFEHDIYNHIINFFSRYYDNGDFMSKRRYGNNERYAIPYNGQEVLLHWANNDQYYIKTTESFHKFSFKISSLQVNFLINNAEEESGNNKSSNSKFFVLSNDKSYELKKSCLDVYFEFRALKDKEKKSLGTKQDKINDNIMGKLKEELDGKPGLGELFKEKDGKSPLSKNLFRYTKKNTTDYFIHKNLRKFLMHELDFYMKNEVLNISNISKLRLGSLDGPILKMNVLKNICNSIIEFLAQIEDFQKKLWEKKKFVLKTDYCITVDYLQEKHLKVVLKNNKQLEEWKRLYGFSGKNITSLEILERPTLMIDTKFFNEDFKLQLLEDIDISDEKINGLLINSDNSQSLNLLKSKYKNRIMACYADPPYNTDGGDFLYKNDYKESSWLSFLNDRINLCRQFLTHNGIMCVTIDDHEFGRLYQLMQQIFVDYDILPVVIEHNLRGRIQSNFALTHEYALYAVKKGRDLITKLPEMSDDIRRNLRRTGNGSKRIDSPSLFYGIEINKKTLKILKTTNPLPIDEQIPKHRNTKTEMIWPLDGDGSERRWYYGPETLWNEIDKKEVYAKKIKGKIQIHYHIPGKQKRRKTTWSGKKYDASTYGSELLNALFGQSPFSYPKSVHAVRECIESITFGSKDVILDFFAGSGTTSHAVLKMNKKDDGKRKYILLEMAGYFDRITKPRIQKAVYSDNWKSGKPLDNDGTKKHIVKYQRLEQYEDALENIEFPQKKLDGFSDYFVRYMLDFETRDSKSFLNIDGMQDPFDYKIRVLDGYQQKIVPVDLVETYNYLIGLHLKKLKTVKDKGRKYLILTGNIDSKKVIVIWRNIKDVDPEKDREFILATIVDEQYDEIHINGNSLIKNAVMIEGRFKKLMMDDSQW